MAPRKKLPDVMGELLGGNTRAAAQAKATKPADQNTGIPVNPQTDIPVDQKGDEKVKATYYLSSQTVDTLEEAKLRLRRLMRTDKRSISSSSIVDAALQIAFADLEAAGVKSRLADILAKQ